MIQSPPNRNDRVGMTRWVGARQYRVVQDVDGQKRWVPASGDGMMSHPPRRHRSKNREQVGPVGRPSASYSVGDTEWVGAALYRVGQDASGKKIWEPAMNAGRAPRRTCCSPATKGLHARDYPENTRRKGTNGAMYKVVVQKNGKKVWRNIV